METARGDNCSPGRRGDDLQKVEHPLVKEGQVQKS